MGLRAASILPEKALLALLSDRDDVAWPGSPGGPGAGRFTERRQLWRPDDRVSVSARHQGPRGTCLGAKPGAHRQLRHQLLGVQPAAWLGCGRSSKPRAGLPLAENSRAATSHRDAADG